NIRSPEFKNIGSEVGIVRLNIDEEGMIDFNELKKNYDLIHNLITRGEIISASTVKYGGIARSISEMALGNSIGFEFKNIDEDQLFKHLYGSIIIEVKEGLDNKELFKDISYERLGQTIQEEEIKISGETISLEELIQSYKETLEEVFPLRNTREAERK